MYLLVKYNYRWRLNLVKVLLHFILLKIAVQLQLLVCPHIMLLPWRYRIVILYTSVISTTQFPYPRCLFLEANCSITVLVIRFYYFCRTFCDFFVQYVVLIDVLFSWYNAKLNKSMMISMVQNIKGCSRYNMRVWYIVFKPWKFM